MDKSTKRPARRDAAYRDNGPDALFGSLLVLEATLRAVIEGLAENETTQERAHRIAGLRQRVEAALEGQHLATRYDTGHQEIRDAAEETLASLFAPSATSA